MKIIKKVGLTLLVLVTLTMALILFWRHDIPEGRQGSAAENLADTLLMTMGAEEWGQIKWIHWKVNDKRAYTWNREEDLAIIKFGAYRVHLNLDSRIGSAWKNGRLLEGLKSDKAILKAWSNWCFDSFLLNPVAKIRDEGTIRKRVVTDDGRSALLVTFTKGGVTPGDTYLFMLDEQKLPELIRMWVRKVPIGGLKMTFEGTATVGEGIQIASTHRIGPVTYHIDDVVVGETYRDLGYDQDPFLFTEQ